MKIAVSGCLLGEKVRFDAGHKRDTFVMDDLSKYAQYISFCPENMAFGNPRPSLRLVKNQDESIKVESNKTGEDLSQQLMSASKKDLESIASHPLCGIILKSKSPSCGMRSAKIYQNNGYVEAKGDGVFAAMCREKFPLLPMEEEGRLCNPWLRENFVMQLFAYERFEKFKQNATMKDLVAFHSVYKFMLQSKDENLYRQLGKIVGNHEAKSFADILEKYELLFKTAIAKKSSKGKTRNVLEHMSGFVKNHLTAKENAMLHEQIDDYATQIIPLILPLSTLKLYAQKYEVNYLLEQTFLSPYPKELALRSDIACVK
ncbi:MAG: hypothetical protein A2019_00475 [Sulfurimonas sp. GWF2_37_8]|nr:MAG: hypothetical protein A2019_00475 [Sulfurimonas sp. GWF2_37_8]